MDKGDEVGPSCQLGFSFRSSGYTCVKIPSHKQSD